MAKKPKKVRLTEDTPLLPLDSEDPKHNRDRSTYAKAATIVIWVFGILLVALVVVFSAALITGAGGKFHKAGAPHILVVMVDDMGNNDVSYNSAEYQTKHIDELARTGVIFRNHYASHVCTPSRAAFLTGRQPLEHGTSIPYVPLTTWSPPSDTLFLSEGLKELGYDTHMVGKWHLGYSSFDDTPLGRGFDSFFGMFGGMVEYYTHDYVDIPAGAEITCQDTEANVDSSGVWGKDLFDGITPVGDQYEGQYVTNLFTNRILDIIQDHSEREDEDPLFLYVSYTAPHDPWQAPFEYIESPECSSIKGDNRKIYCGMMQVLDEGLRNITSALANVGYLDNTLLLFVSDNGAAVNDAGLFSNEVEPAGSNYPYRGAKNTLFEGGPRTPAFLWGNPVRPGTVADGEITTSENKGTDFLVHISDWYLTLLNAGAALDEDDEVHVAKAKQKSTSSSFGDDASKFPGSKDAMKTAIQQGDLPQVFYTSETTDGSLLESSFNQWDRFRYGGPNPRTSVIYHFQYPTDPEYAAIRNKDYKLFVGTNMPIVDGWFDTSNKSREVVRCMSRNECSDNPVEMFWKISEDPEERYPLDTSNLDATEQGHLDELRHLLSQWKSVVVPTPDQTLDAQGLPRYWDCTWHPWISTETHPLPEAASCTESVDPACGPRPSVKDWERYT